MSFEVFISYSSKDKPVADALCNHLESQQIRCWIAPRDVPPGKSWAEAIIDALNECKVMVLVFSQNANTSKQVVLEVERAVHKGVSIVPFRIEDCLPTRAMELFLSTWHWLDAMSPPLQSHIVKLVSAVTGLLALSRSGETIPQVVDREGDQKFVRAFAEIAPDDWYAGSQNVFVRFFRKILDEN